MVSISKSRFAVLKIEDEDEEGKNQSAGRPPNQNQSNSAAAKKKNKKKKQREADESLRNLAFGRQGGTRTHKNSGGSADHRHGRHAESDNWDEWRRRDEENTQDMFEKDLQQALLLSRMEEEHQKETQKTTESQLKAGVPVDSKDGKKKKKKDKPQAMSLEQFNQLPPERAPGSDDEEAEPSPPPVHTRVPTMEQDPRFFDNIQNDVHKIVKKERIQEEYKKQYAQESAMASKYQDQLEKKDAEIAQLKAQLKEQEDELKQVKKRNKQLCVILAQGEMKDKAQVLMQVDELTAVKDELTEQVSALTADLEKERSKVHALKSENDKMKSKHGSK